ncbi:MAG: insulinase family protein [Chloroflexi bacterium]|nr:insulinase family protein [Chloroflexota bacterium]
MKPDLYLDKENRIAFSRSHGAGSFSLVVSVRDGTAYEDKDEWGAGHFLEHLHFQGCKGYPSFFDLVRAVEEKGGRFAAQTVRQAVTFWIKVPAEFAGFAFSLLGDMFATYEFSAGSIEKEKKIIHEEVSREKHQPSLYNSIRLENKLLSPRPLCRHPLGPPEGVNFSGEFISSYKKRVYNAENFMFGACGDMDFSEVKNSISAFFPPSSDAPRPLAAGEYPVEDADKKIDIVPFPSKQQVSMALGTAIPRENDKTPLTALFINTMIGAGFGSILFQKFRVENPYAYLPTTSLRFYPGILTFRMNIQVSPPNLNPSLSLIFKTLKELASGEIKDEDIARTRGTLKGALLYRSEDTLETAKFINSSLVTGEEPEEPARLLEKINNISKEDLIIFAGRHLAPDGLKISLMGDVENIKEELYKCQDLNSTISEW